MFLKQISSQFWKFLRRRIPMLCKRWFSDQMKYHVYKLFYNVYLRFILIFGNSARFVLFFSASAYSYMSLHQKYSDFFDKMGTITNI